MRGGSARLADRIRKTFGQSDPNTNGLHRTIMRNKIIIMLSLSVAGCALNFGSWGDPCDQTSPAYPGLSDAHKASCVECGAVEDCADETGGTGEVAVLDCNPEIGPWCALSHTHGDQVPDGYTQLGYSDCASTSNLHVHLDDWASSANPPVTDSRIDVLCDTGEIVGDPLLGLGYANVDGIGLCTSPGQPTEYYPALAAVGPPSDVWPSTAGCAFGEHVGHCGLGLVSVGGDGMGFDDPGWPAEWTCACASDADCQSGAVCQAGWYFDGMIPQPSLCTWDVAQETDPGGPRVYGLTTWDDGIKIDGRVITMTAAMLMAAVPGRAALWNDAQSFDSDGVLTRCNPGALCAHLGLVVGERVELDPSDMGLLPAGEVVPITVHHLDGSTDAWVLQQGAL